MLNRSEPNVILTAHATKVNRPEPNWTEPQTCLAGRNHAFIQQLVLPYKRWFRGFVAAHLAQSARFLSRRSDS